MRIGLISDLLLVSLDAGTQQINTFKVQEENLSFIEFNSWLRLRLIQITYFLRKLYNKVHQQNEMKCNKKKKSDLPKKAANRGSVPLRQYIQKVTNPNRPAKQKELRGTVPRECGNRGNDFNKYKNGETESFGKFLVMRKRQNT